VAGGLVDKSGSWYSYAGERIGQGRENAKAFLTEHPDVAAKIEAQMLEKLNQEREAAAAAVPAEAAGDEGFPDEVVRVDEDGVVVED